MLLALPYPTMNFLPFYAAEDLGFFSRAGVNIHCLHRRDGGYTCAITAAGVRFQSEVLALAKGVSKKVSLGDVADLSFLEKARTE
ncbi:MAG: hypothetical protein ACREPG_05160 [Candidatus Binatia bacterium]